MTAKNTASEAALQAVLDVARAEELALLQDDARLRDAGLQRLVEGTLPADELQELQRRAQHDPELAEALKLFALPSAAQDQAMPDAVVATLSFASAGQHDLARARARRSVRGLTMWAPALAVAAAVAIFVVVGRNAPPGEALPAYSVTVQGGEAPVRGAAPSTESLRLMQDAPVETILRPQTTVAYPVAVSGYARFPSDGPWVPLTVSFEIGQTGAMRLAANVSSLLPDRKGTGVLVFVIHSAHSAQPTLDALNRDETDPAWRKLVVPVFVVSDASTTP